MEPKASPKDSSPDQRGVPTAPETGEQDVYPIVDLRPSRLRSSGLAVFTAVLVAIFLSGCQTQQQRDAERERARQDVKSAAYKAGEAARRISTEAEKASAEAARKLKESARKADEGWRDQERKDREQTSH